LLDFEASDLFPCLSLDFERDRKKMRVGIFNAQKLYKMFKLRLLHYIGSNLRLFSAIGAKDSQLCDLCWMPILKHSPEIFFAVSTHTAAHKTLLA
jgi:hypothetical protein